MIDRIKTIIMSQYVSTLSEYKLNYLRDFEDRNKHLSVEPERLYNAVQKSLSALREPITKEEFVSYFNGSHWVEINFPKENELKEENKIIVSTAKVSLPAEDQIKVDTIPKETHVQVRNSNNLQEFTNAEIALNSGYKKFAAQNYRGAAKEFQKSIDAGYEKALCLEFMGRIELATLNYTKAKSYFDKAIALNPYNCQTYSLRGMTKEAQGDLEGYIRDLEKAKQVYALDHPQAKEHSEEMDRLSLQQSGRTFLETCNTIILAQSTLITANASIEKTDRQLRELGINDDEFEVLNTFFDDNYENKREQLSNVYIAYKGAHQNNFVSWSTFKAYFSKFYIEQELKQFKDIIVDDYYVEGSPKVLDKTGNDSTKKMIPKKEDIYDNEESIMKHKTSYQKFKIIFPYYWISILSTGVYMMGIRAAKDDWFSEEHLIFIPFGFLIFWALYILPAIISFFAFIFFKNFPFRLYKALVILQVISCWISALINTA